MYVRNLPVRVGKDTIDSIAGLPEELGVGDDLTKSSQRASIRIDTRRYGKAVTIVDGLDPSVIDLNELASELKRQLAVGGSVVDGRIELQGNHRERVADLLGERGIDVDV